MVSVTALNYRNKRIPGGCSPCSKVGGHEFVWKIYLEVYLLITSVGSVGEESLGLDCLGLSINLLSFEDGIFGTNL